MNQTAQRAAMHGDIMKPKASDRARRTVKVSSARLARQQRRCDRPSPDTVGECVSPPISKRCCSPRRHCRHHRYSSELFGVAPPHPANSPAPRSDPPQEDDHRRHPGPATHPPAPGYPPPPQPDVFTYSNPLIFLKLTCTEPTSAVADIRREGRRCRHPGPTR